MRVLKLKKKTTPLKVANNRFRVISVVVNDDAGLIDLMGVQLMYAEL